MSQYWSILMKGGKQFANERSFPLEGLKNDEIRRNQGLKAKELGPLLGAIDKTLIHLIHLYQVFDT